MPQLPVLTTELARRIERCVAPELTSPGETTDPTAPCVAQFGRTVASKSKGGWPANKVFCFCHEDIGRLNEILAFYAADGGRLRVAAELARGRDGDHSTQLQAGRSTLPRPL